MSISLNVNVKLFGSLPLEKTKILVFSTLTLSCQNLQYSEKTSSCYKLVLNNINGKMYCLILNMYDNIESCVVYKYTINSGVLFTESTLAFV
jgi:hypothetical protein